ncbi:uncharacterized protein C2orf42 homolog isoform X4 [Anarhichas minor]|uniref:uncharacterized protein C2orf42 homolog isoform X4 n=1 Tax=Anarhichas minor TaxID=65739 RepID=UPI003F737498
METEVTASSSSSNVVSSSAPQTFTAQANLAAKQRDGKKTTATTPAFLYNLGRATLRGIRKCPQCGVYNGTRGLSCKNKACGITLRNASSAAGRSSRKCAVDVVSSSSSSRKSKHGVDAAGGSTNSHPPSLGPVTSQPCLHFYACVCAFASDEELASEFTAFIKYTPSGVQHNATCRVVSPGEKPLQQADPLNAHLKTKKLRLDEPLSVASTSGVWRRAGQRRAPGAGGLKAPGSSQLVDERTVTMGFQQWLAGVTERIHQTMHYQFDGKPEPLVYHIPQEFFNALQQRLSLGSKKRRLPNFTTAFVRNDGLPLGSFSKYTWHITNLMQVKRIFDSSELPLELFQSFVKNADGSYSSFRCPEPPPEPEPPEGHRTDRPQAIRPMELRTFLKVGPADQKEAAPFVIEWIPDVLPRCRMGELRIGFEFGHQQSGQPENCEKTSAAAEKGGRGKSDSTQTKHSKAVEILQLVV